MTNFGISLYVQGSSLKEISRDMEMAHTYGCRKIFTSLLPLTASEHANTIEALEKLNYITTKAKQLQMRVIADINDRSLAYFHASEYDLSTFAKLGIQGLRVDHGLHAMQIAEMTNNPFDIEIVISAALRSDGILKQIFAFYPRRRMLRACHNYYPKRYSGQCIDVYKNSSEILNSYGILTDVFVTSQSVNAKGPWQFDDRLPTLEMHRDWSMERQIRHVITMGVTGDIIISNAHFDEHEMNVLKELPEDIACIYVQLYTKDAFVKGLVLTQQHIYRGDSSGYAIRSMMTRFHCSHYQITPDQIQDIKAGDLLVDNMYSGQYNGEIQIALQDMKCDGTTNVIGRIGDDEMHIVRELSPWQHFYMKEEKNEK